MEKSGEALEKLKIALNGIRGFLESKNLALPHVTRDVCPPLREALEDLCLRIEKRHEVDESKSEGDIYVIHYTSIAALMSMLQEDASKSDEKYSLRLYDSVHLNDPDEGNYLASNLKLPQKYDWLKKEDVSHAYIASFILPNSDSREDMSDDLVFWRTYGQEGEGCSLSLPIPRRRLQKVLYGTKEVKSTIGLLRPALDFLLDSLEPLVRIRKQPLRNDIRGKLAEVVWESLERFRYSYKSEAYKHENECRFVIAESNIIDKNKICFEYQDRNNNPARIRHYYEHDDLGIEKLLISGSSITLGPCVSNAYNLRYYLEALKRRAGLLGPEIKISNISYQRA